MHNGPCVARSSRHAAQAYYAKKTLKKRLNMRPVLKSVSNDATRGSPGNEAQFHLSLLGLDGRQDGAMQLLRRCVFRHIGGCAGSLHGGFHLRARMDG